MINIRKISKLMKQTIGIIIEVSSQSASIFPYKTYGPIANLFFLQVY